MDVGIIIALTEEFEIFDGTFAPLCKPIPRPRPGVVSYTFKRPSADPGRPYDCVVCLIGKMGPTGAALVTQRMIRTWNPKNIVMLGIAAGISKDVRLGDVLVADSVDSYADGSRIGDDSGLEFSGEVYQCSARYVESLKHFRFSKRKLYDHWAGECAQRLRRINSELGAQAGEGDDLVAPVPGLHVGPVASGPVVVASSAFLQLLLKRNRKFLGVEMEAAGVLAAVHKDGDQRHTLVLRGLSDFGDERKKELDGIGGGVFRSYAMTNATELLWYVLSAGMLEFSDREKPAQRVASAGQVVIGVPSQIFEEVADRGKWDIAINHVLRHIRDDMHTEGDCSGGWGKSYAGRYWTRTYPQGVPQAFAPQPDTPSGTAMIVEGLSCLRQIPGLLSLEEREMIGSCLAETSKYFLDRFDPATGAVGVKTLLAAGYTATAPDLRHSALSLKAFHSLPGLYSQLGRCSEYLIRSSEATDLEAEHVLKVVAVMSGLAWISATDDLKHGLPEAHKLSFLIKKAEVALLKNWSPTASGWLDGNNPTTTFIWYSLLVLKDLGRINAILGPELVGRGEHTLRIMFDFLQEMPDDELAMPYRIGGPPDLGMSCMLFEILTRTQPTPRTVSIMRGLGRFIIAHTNLLDTPDHDYVKDTYPWTLVSLFGGLSVLLCK